MTDQFKYIITADYIKNAFGVDFKARLTTPSNVDIELKQNYRRLFNYVLANNVYLKQATTDYLTHASNKAIDYNKEADNPIEAFNNQFLDDDLVEDEYRIDQWKQAQALQAIYELDNGIASMNPNFKGERICPEVKEILLNTLSLIWRMEGIK